MNKTGAKLEYRISNQKTSYFDSGSGGLPVMIHGRSKSKRAHEKSSSDISVLPLESPRLDLAKIWWDEASNGVLVLSTQDVIDEHGRSPVQWSKAIDMDAGECWHRLCRCF